MSILSKLERLIGLEKKRHHHKKAKARKSKKRMPKGLREYWAKKRRG